MKIFWLFNHPAPYKVNLFNFLGEKADLEVYFERGNEKGRNLLFYSQKPISFKATICKSIRFGKMDNISRDPIEALKHNQYDVIVLNGWRTLTEQKTINFCKKQGIPYIFMINGGIIRSPELPIIRHYKRHFISGARAYLAPDGNSSSYLTHYGADPSKITLYPYSSIFKRELVKAPLSKAEKEDLRKKLGLSGEKIYVSAGQFIPRKNFTELIRIWAKRPQGDSLYILGEGKDKKKLDSLIKGLNLTNVHLLPYKKHEEILSYFAASDCFVFLSKEDIYGHVISEALSQALPVVSSTCVNAAKRLIKDGQNGYLIPLEDEGVINEKLSLFPDEKLSLGALSTGRENTLEESAEFLYSYFEDYCR